MLWALNRKVGSSSPSVGMMFSHHFSVQKCNGFPHPHTGPPSCDGYLAFAGGQIPLTMSHPSAEGSGGTLDLVPTPVS